MPGYRLACAVVVLALIANPQASARAESLTAPVRADSRPVNLPSDLSIAFSLDSARLSVRSMRRLDQIAARLRSSGHAAARIQIAGHSDSSGSPAHNKSLSRQRALAVKTYLVERHGLSPSRLETVAWGEEKLKHPGDPRGPGNRRVELAVMAPIESLLQAANGGRVEAPATFGDSRQIKIEW